ncbi:MAG: hypothetical protein ABSE63_01710 [Thermoguttaceae bacterium]
MRTFIVEDNEQELIETATYLRTRFPKIGLLTAQTSQSARAALKITKLENQPINVAILDLFLGEQFDFGLAIDVWNEFPGSLLVHYTYHDRDTQVREYIRERDKKQRFIGRSEIINKREDEGMPLLWETIRQWWEKELLQMAIALHSSEISASIISDSRPAPPFTPEIGLRCDTIGINSLLCEISDFWEHINPETQSKINKLVFG